MGKGDKGRGREGEGETNSNKPNKPNKPDKPDKPNKPLVLSFCSFFDMYYLKWFVLKVFSGLLGEKNSRSNLSTVMPIGWLILEIISFQQKNTGLYTRISCGWEAKGKIFFPLSLL